MEKSRLQMSAIRTMFYLVMIFALLLGLMGSPLKTVQAANPTPYETYFVPLPDDWLMQHMEDIDANDSTYNPGTGDPYKPIRSVIGISISASHTLIYYDQWEPDSGTAPAYDADIANPVDLYSASNPNGTQIWGDENLSNGCPPRFRNLPNPCASPSDDLLHTGDVIVLDNLVPLNSTGHGPWIGSRVVTEVRFDGKDKFGATYPVAATRAGWSEGDIDGAGPITAAGAMFSDATSIEPTSEWGTSYITPIGYNPPGMTAPIDYSHVTVQASVNNTTVCVDTNPATNPRTCNQTATINAGEQFDPTTMGTTTSPQGLVAGAEIWSTDSHKPVQVILITGDVGSTWSNRWYNIKPYNQWTSDYYQPVGTAGTASAIWVYNPNDKQITVTIQRPGGTDSGPCAAKSSCKMPNIPAGEGGHGTAVFSDGTGPAVFYAVSVTEASGDNDPGGVGAQGDYDMSGSRLRTCDGTKFAAAWGQQPSLSYSGDEEGLDMGTVIFPLGSNIFIDKSVSPLFVDPGGQVTYTYAVRTTGLIPLTDIRVTDNYCAPADYDGGDTDDDGFLEVSETWFFTCLGSIFIDSTNIATASGSPDGNTTIIQSSPAQASVVVTSNIGDYVWVDEDGDGDQDAGEPGIPNVKLTLTGRGFIGTIDYGVDTYTDSNGRYAFTSLLPSNPAGYTITVDTTTLHPGLAANPTYDENGTGTAHIATVLLGSNVEHMTTDFGYNWSGVTETNTGTGLGAIGDRVWLDSNGNGLQEPNEVVISAIFVELYYDGPVPDGYIDVLHTSTTTDVNGNYIFDELQPGIYEVRIPTSQVGYPPNGHIRSEIAAYDLAGPIVLGPGDVFLNADFGYTCAQCAYSTIGDTIYFDSNNNGTVEAGEPGIPGVSVALVNDLGIPGTFEEEIDKVIATDLTDATGTYSFPGLAAGSYYVWVNDVQNVTYELDLRGDPDGGTFGPDGISRVIVDGATSNQTQDFGYYPLSHLTSTGVLGDTIWLDRDAGGDFDPGEGLERVVVILRDYLLRVISRTITDEYGNYTFGHLPAGTYTIEVDTSTLPNSGTGLYNSFDPEAGAANQALVTISGTGQLNIDFGYRATTPNSIGGTIWEDSNANGTQLTTPSSDESYMFQGVTVYLYNDFDSDGMIGEKDMLIGTTISDSVGHFDFSGLPDGAYIVDVMDDDNVLNGYWHSLGTQGEADEGQSKLDPYPITLSGGEVREAIDFGYYIWPGSLGDWVWADYVRDGIQDPDGSDNIPGNADDEKGLPDMVLTLTITWPGDSSTILRTKTDAGGGYSFPNLLLDEDHNGVGSVNPYFTILVEKPWLPYSSPTIIHVPSDIAIDSGEPLGEPATTSQGYYNPTYDFGFWYGPNAVNITTDIRYDVLLNAFVITWESMDEGDISGYYLSRTEELTGIEITLNPGFIQTFPAKPYTYAYADRDISQGVSYVYELEVVNLQGITEETITLGPVIVYNHYVPLLTR